MAYRKLKSSRSRLVAIMLTVFAPIASLMAVAAWSNLQFTTNAIQRDYALQTNNAVSRLRIWLRGIERSLVTSASALATLEHQATPCADTAQRITRAVSGIDALIVRFSAGNTCAYTPDTTDITAITSKAAAGYAFKGVGPDVAGARIYLDPAGKQQAVILQVEANLERGGDWSATALIDPSVLRGAVALGDRYPGSVLAIAMSDGRIVATNGADGAGDAWLPADHGAIKGGQRVAEGRDGVYRYYISQPLIGDGIYVFAGFDRREISSARNQFLLLLAMPLLVLGSLALVFMRAIDLYVLRWLGRIEVAVRERQQLKSARIAISPSMPAEIGHLAFAFNEMAQAEEQRRGALESALEENRFLIRELHHRVKNSLQVVQSYIAIEAREKSGDVRNALVDAEQRVKIMSIAYRIAMADGTIRSVDLGEFVAQTVQALAGRLGRAQIIRQDGDNAAIRLELEKVIALGFLMADACSRASEAAERFILSLRLEQTETDDALVLRSDTPLTLSPEPRINRGLMLQLEATHVKADEGDTSIVAGWKWTRPASA